LVSHAATGHDPFLYGRAGRVHRILHSRFLLLQLGFGCRSNPDHCHAAHQFRQPFLQLLTKHKQLLFTPVVALAEKEGRPVHLLVVPSSNVHDAITHIAAQLESAEVIDGPSPVLQPKEQAKRFRKAWEKLSNRPGYQIVIRIINPDGNTHEFLI